MIEAQEGASNYPYFGCVSNCLAKHTEFADSWVEDVKKCGSGAAAAALAQKLSMVASLNIYGKVAVGVGGIFSPALGTLGGCISGCIGAKKVIE